MRVIIKNTVKNTEKTYIVKVRYEETPELCAKDYEKKDKFGREIWYRWTERYITVNAYLWQNKEKVPNSFTTFNGRANCHYEDAKNYKKKIGKKMAWDRCVNAMLTAGEIDEFEAEALKKWSADSTVLLLTMNDTDYTMVRG